MADSTEKRNKGKPRGKPIQPGQVLNPGGRPKLSDEQKSMKLDALNKAIAIMYAKINDKNYIDGLKPNELEAFLALVFDRCGLPKVQRNENDNNERVLIIRDP